MALKISLVGYNVYAPLLQAISAGKKPEPETLTPEILSAAFARISRSEKSVTELLEEAAKDVKKARKSNQNIVFEMGHSSIAEHAILNFALEDISRIALEEIEHHRLNSYTEKSQRYVTLHGSHLIPDEIRYSRRLEEFMGIIRLQNKAYQSLFTRLKGNLSRKEPETAKSKEGVIKIETAAKEDARYLLSLSTLGQLGMTINTRNLEYLVRRLASHPLHEINLISHKLMASASAVVPSLLKYYQSSRYLQPKNSRQFIPETKEPESQKFQKIEDDLGPVRLVHEPFDADEKIIAGFLHPSNFGDYVNCCRKAKSLDKDEKVRFFKEIFSRMSLHDAAPRELEQINLTYEIILSAAAFAQLKRHRMMALTKAPYDLSLGMTVPESIVEIGEKSRFEEVVEKTSQLYSLLEKENNLAREYVLTNAHRRRVMATINARELYHLSRLREDGHAQWDLRGIAGRMLEQAKAVMPLTMMLACGKDRFDKLRGEVYGRE